MSLLSYVEDMISFGDEVARFTVDLLNQWTCSINPSHIPLSEFSEITWSGTMSRYHDETSLWDLREIRLKYDTFPLEHAYHKGIVDDLVIHIDRSWMGRNNLHEHPDGSVNSCAITTGECSIDRKH